jgi:hypothetical protein
MAAKKPGSLFRAPTVEDVAQPQAAESTTPKRGKHLISGMFEQAAYRQFGVLAAELGVNKQDLLREALNDLFVKHGKPPIA